MKALLRLIFMLVLIAGVGGVLAVRHLQAWYAEPLLLARPVNYQFVPGTRLRQLAADLETSGAIDSAFKFRMYVRYFGNYQSFQSGSYQFGGETSPARIVDDFAKGRIYTPVALQITIPEGFTAKQVLERLTANGVGSKAENQRLFANTALLKRLRIPGPSLEGFLYPATYQFAAVPTATEAIERFVNSFWEKLPIDYEKKAKAMRISLLQAVTFASLIELETMFEDEMPMISEVIWRRLKDGAPLGIDAAVIYGIPNYKGDIRWADLRDAKNRYNTRIHKGLPPTPIGSPSTKALQAVLTPANTGYYFYVLKTDGSGRHTFTKTAKEHNAEVKKLLESSSNPSTLQRPTQKPTSTTP